MTESAPRPDWGHSSHARPLPPFQLRECAFLMVGAQFDRPLAQSLLPPGLEAADEGSGGFYMYTAPKGRAAPFTATLAWIDVKGFDSSDGSRGRFQTVSHYSEPFSSLAHGWNRLAQTGYSELTQQGAVLSGRGGPDGEVHLRASIQSSGGASTAVAGTHYYVMVNDKGDLQQVPVAYCYDYLPASVLRFENVAPASSNLGRMVPKRLHWAAALFDAVITIGAPLPIARNAEAAGMQVVHLNLLAQHGRGAVVVGPDGRILFHNDAVTAMAGRHFSIETGHLHCADAALESQLLGQIEHMLRGGKGTDPIAVARGTDRRPIFVQPILLDSGGAAQPGEGSVLLLVTDLELPLERDALGALQILGLSPAEARIADLVGSGQPPKEAARRLGNTEGTVRFSLHQIYRKLGISRQSELARLVARIQAIGI
ncbi:MAG: helix-turn-helix transcriptional regulator [Devosia sp.]|nr:helix-turn-helix transcriptional regulator [Devosia sp.]